MFILVCYDVASDRTERFRKHLGMYLSRIQNSVFAGDLDAAGKRKMMAGLREMLMNGDNVLVFEAKNRNNVVCERISADGSRNLSSRIEDGATGGDLII